MENLSLMIHRRSVDVGGASEGEQCFCFCFFILSSVSNIVEFTLKCNFYPNQYIGYEMITRGDLGPKALNT